MVQIERFGIPVIGIPTGEKKMGQQFYLNNRSAKTSKFW